MDPVSQVYPGDAVDPGNAPVFAAGMDGVFRRHSKLLGKEQARPRRTRK